MPSRQTDPEPEWSTSSTPVTPSSALLPGNSDPVVVLLLWAGRRAFWPLLLVGASVAVVMGRSDSDSVYALSSPADLAGALLSPLAGVAAAVLLRLVINWLALLAAWPLSRWHHVGRSRSWPQIFRDFIDRWRLAQAYRSLRWTWGVRAEAIERAGELGRRLGLAVPLSAVATLLAAAAFTLVALRVPN
jgi:hypothetical protein